LACVSDPTVIGEVLPVADCVVPPSLEVQVTVKPVTVSPPSLPAANATIPESLPRVTPEMVGAEGRSAATNAVDAVDAGLSATALVATTTQVYDLALVSEATVIGDVESVADSVAPPSLDVQVAVKSVIGLPPVPLEVKATIAELLPRVTPETLGAGGAVPTTKELEAADAGLLPVSFVATILHV
jgi:hypothetical protein